MAKRRPFGDVTTIRLFDVLDQSALAELPDSGFGKEAHMQKLIENNIEMLFPGLTFLTSEFRGMGGGELRPDTIAFDMIQNSFVALEYKNKPNKEAVDQARTYVDFMLDHKGDLAMLYNDQAETPRKSDSFNWKEIYAIVIEPDFTKYQISGADKDNKMELYKIRMHGHVIMMQRVGGGHQQTSLIRSTSKPKPKIHNPEPRRDTKSPATEADGQTKPAQSGSDDSIKLPEIQYEQGQKAPAAMIFPDDSRVGLKSWRDILANVANWLVNKGHLDESHCPVPIGPNNAVLNTRPVHQNGKRFAGYAKAGHLYVFLNVSPKNAILNAIKLIGMAGLNPSDFGVSSDILLGASNRSDMATDAPRRVEPTQNGAGGYAILSDIQYEKGKKPPEALTFPDGSQVSMRTWSDILFHVAWWLVNKDYLDELHCPVPRGPKTAILNTESVHQNGKSFMRPQRVGYLYVEMNVDPKSAILCSIRLIETAELDPAGFVVHL